MKKKNTFINGTASMGRGLLYAYLYIMFRPKICYQSRKAKEEIEKGGVIFIGNHVANSALIDRSPSSICTFSDGSSSVSSSRSSSVSPSASASESASVAVSEPVSPSASTGIAAHSVIISASIRQIIRAIILFICAHLKYRFIIRQGRMTLTNRVEIWLRQIGFILRPVGLQRIGLGI